MTVVLALALTSLLLIAAALRFPARTIVVVGMLFAAGLILSLARLSSTKYSVHPDEFSHWSAFYYYVDHWAPPAVDDPSVQPSISAWGYSYLYELNATYWVAARVMSPLRALFDSDRSEARAFQCLLWLVLCWLALRRKKAAIALSVLLLSPQLWYVFAYFNSDAFSLFAALSAVVLLCASRPDVFDYVRGDGAITWRVLLFTACLGTLLICKPNYAVLAPGFLLWVAVLQMDLRWRELAPVLAALALLGAAVFLGDPALGGALARDATVAAAMLLLGVAALGIVIRCRGNLELRRIVLRLIALSLLAAAFAAPRVVFDVYANGMPSTKAARIQAVKEATAWPLLKPSAIEQGKGAEYLTTFAQRGVGLTQMLFQAPYRWVAWSAVSAFGMYGYMTVSAPYAVYVLLLATSLAMSLLALLALRRALPDKAGRLIFVAAGIGLLVIESSILHNWIDAFQPQGRYLFPIFAMLSLALATGARGLSPRPFRFVLACAALTSAYSFLFVAIPGFMPFFS